MKPLHIAIASILTVAALTLSSHAYSQSAPISYVLRSDPSMPDITTKQQQEEVMKLFTAHVGLWLTRDPNSYPYEKLITDDAVFEYPYAQTDSARHIVGREAVAEALRKLPRGESDWQFDDVQLFQTAHPEIFFVSYKLSAAHRAYTQTYLARITVRNGQIANYYELWDRSVSGVVSATNLHN
jgi:ketosteroid isomerase-like protein